jgi:hypothetical protein
MTDDDLLARIRAAFNELDPVPEDTMSAARAAIRWRDPDAALAALTDDLPVPAGVRSSAPARLLTFTGPGVTVELEVTRHALTGRLTPPATARIHLRHPGGELTTRADRTGRFTLPAVPPGLVSLVFHLPDATSIVTSWVRL